MSVSRTGTFARFIAENGLIDEVLFWVNPSVHGKGDRKARRSRWNSAVEGLDSGVALLRSSPIAS